MPASTNKKVNDILAGCESLFNDFDLPEEHSGRFVSIHKGDNNDVDDISTPGNDSAKAAAVSRKKQQGKTEEQGESNKSSSSELARSKKAWGRAIDKYVASVLEENNKSSTFSADKSSSGRSKRSGGSRSIQLVHPDNHLLAAIQASGDNASHASSGSYSVNINGQIDDSSFAPINPFDDDDMLSSPNEKSSWKNNKKIEWLKSYLKEEWKPISLIVLVIFVTIIVSAAMGGNDGSGSDNSQVIDNGGTFALDTTPVTTDDKESRTGLLDDDTGMPTFSPTWTDEGYPTFVPSARPVEKIVTEEPTTKVDEIMITDPPSSSPTERKMTPFPTNSSPLPTYMPTPKPSLAPTGSPSNPPSMPQKYNEMKKAAIYVSGSDEPFTDTSSSQSLAFHWLYYEGNPSTTLFEFFEQYAVAVIFFSLTKARTSYAYMNPESVYDSWVERKDVCGWEGVRCAYNYTSDMVHITEINLCNKNLTGEIPEIELGFLPYVSRLDLSENEIGGTIPETVYELERLRHLFLNNNKLMGTISPNIDNLYLAQEIYLGQNSLTGMLPANIGTNRPNNWRFFSVYQNQLTGPIHTNMKLKNMYMLDLSRNEFYGTIPEDITQENFSTLRLLYMDHNLLTGTIPGSLMQMRKMKGLFLNDNLLEGMIPYNIDEEQKAGMLTIRVQNNRLTQPVASVFCDLDVNLGYYELVELGVDCEICPSDCSICQGRCY